jgi:hypothetical protein
MNGSLRLLVSAPWVMKIRWRLLDAGSSSSLRKSLPRGLDVQSAEDLRGGALLPVSVYVRHAVVAEADEVA